MNCALNFRNLARANVCPRVWRCKPALIQKLSEQIIFFSQKKRKQHKYTLAIKISQDEYRTAGL